jgi:hypothetical protein
MTSANPIIILDDETLAHFRKLIAKRAAIATREAPQNGRTDIGQCLVDSGYSNPRCGYKVMKVNEKYFYLHRMALMAALECEETGQHCAHACDRRKCFNAEHLRFTTASENQLDRYRYGAAVRGGPRAPKSSRFVGVSRVSNAWRSQIKDGRVSRSLGYFQSEIEAARAYNSVAMSLNASIADPRSHRRLNDV